MAVDHFVDEREREGSDMDCKVISDNTKAEISVQYGKPFAECTPAELRAVAVVMMYRGYLLTHEGNDLLGLAVQADLADQRRSERCD